MLTKTAVLGALAIALALLASPACAANAAFSGPLELDFGYGQSTAAGANGCPAITTTPPLPNQVFMPNDLYKVGGSRVHRLDSTPGVVNAGITDIVPAAEADAPYPLTPDKYCETGVVAMLAQRAFLGAKTKFIGRSDAVIGASAAGLGPGTNPYSNMVSEFQTVQALAEAHGGSVTIGRILLNHGQIDRIYSTSPSDYYTLWYNTISRFAADTGQQPIWYLAELSASGVNNAMGSPISAAQYTLALGASAHPAVRLCFPQYLMPTTPADGLHYTAQGYIWQGEYIGKCMQNQNWKPLYPVEIGFSSSDRSYINTIWSVPVPPLRFDTADVIQGPAFDHGLRFVDDCTRSQTAPYTTIQAVTLTPNNRLLIKLTAPWNSACTNPTLQNAYDGPSLASFTQLPTVGTSGRGGTPGSNCILTATFDPATSRAQAQYSATISSSGGLSSIDRLAYPGLYSSRYAADFANVPVSGCGLTGATVNLFALRPRNDSLTMSGAWSDLADSDLSMSRTGKPMVNYAMVFSLPVSVPPSRANAH